MGSESPIPHRRLKKSEYGVLAQVVEHLTFNQVVRGSSPRWLRIRKTPKNQHFRGFLFRQKQTTVRHIFYIFGHFYT